MVTKLLYNKGDKNQLGKHYIQRLISRHPELKMNRNQHIDVKHLMTLDPDIIKRFFAKFKYLRNKYTVKSQDIYNMDETDFQIGQTASKYVVFDPAIDHPVAPTSDNT